MISYELINSYNNKNFFWDEILKNKIKKKSKVPSDEAGDKYQIIDMNESNDKLEN
jgi:hypothetical protein